MNWASLVLRFGLGVMFTAHGLKMTFGMFGGSGVEGFSRMLGNMLGVPAIAWAYIASYSALVGGICVLLGLFTRLAVIPLVIFMLVALIKVHLTKGFFLSSGGFEYNFIILCSLAALFILGGGKFGVTDKF